MAGGQGAVNVSLLDRLGIYLPFLIDFLLFYFFYFISFIYFSSFFLLFLFKNTVFLQTK